MPTPKCPFSPAGARPVGSRWICAIFLHAINDPAFPFAADAELPPKKEGSAKVFDRRRQLYAGVLGEVGAEERRGEMGVRE